MIFVQTETPMCTLFDDPPTDEFDGEPVHRPFAARVQRGRAHDEPDPSQPTRQRCGGGYRVIRKRISD